MNITRGKKQEAQKIVLYGPEGIGKSTFAAQFPEPLFIDTEGSTSNMDVARLDPPGSFTMLLEEIRYVRQHPEACRTLVIDSADWAEQLCITEFCAKKQIAGIEDLGYGKGYVYVSEDFGRMLNLLEEVKKQGINIVITAHAQMRKFEQPDEMGAYDRWELKLQKKNAPMLKEWADMVLFANYKTIVVNVDNQGAAKGKNKAQGGKRVMYTEHHPCWDAKNRHGLPAELSFTYASIAHCIPVAAAGNETGAISAVYSGTGAETKEKPKPAGTAASEKEKTVFDSLNSVSGAGSTEKAAGSVPGNHAAKDAEDLPEKPDGSGIPEAGSAKKADGPDSREGTSQEASAGTVPPEETKKAGHGIPHGLLQLIEANRVTPEDVMRAVESRGYYPKGTPIANYDPAFVDGVLVAAWPKVYAMIKENKQAAGEFLNIPDGEADELPFN